MAAYTSSSAMTISTPTALSLLVLNCATTTSGAPSGPVWIPKIYQQRNKSFFFVSEEARRIVTYSNPTGAIPYSGMTNGQFSHVVCTQWSSGVGATPACGAYGTSIPASSINPVAAAYVKDLFSKFPSPNLVSATNPF